MKRIISYLKPYGWRMLAGISIKAVASLSELLLPWILSYMIDSVIPQERMGLVLLWGGIMVACSVVCFTGNVTANRMASAVARDASLQIRHDLFCRTVCLSCAQADRIGVASLVSRMTTDTYNVHRMIGMMQRLGVRAPLLLIGGICVTLSIDVPLTLVMVGTLPFIALTIVLVSVKGLPRFKKLQNSIDGLVRVVRENVTGARIIKALCKTEHETERFCEQSKQVAEDEATANIVMSVNQPVMNILLNAGMACVILLGARRVSGGEATAASIVAFLSYFTIIANAMMGVTRLFVMFSRASASADRICEILEIPRELEKEEAPAGDAAYRIEFRDVTFSYNKRRPAVEHISFRIRKGEKLGIIGPTGSGKSTLVSLLMRFYDPDEGQIFIDGKDVRTFEGEELHRLFGAAFQNDTVFSDTVRGNIDFGRGLPEEDIRRAMADAQSEEFIAHLSQGLMEPLNSQGTNLSGGQRQRLLITRALAGSPDILVLDDSSSALDFKTDASLRHALSANRQGATCVLIASRVSSVAHCDRILFLEDGKILRQGTHEDLMENCAPYREIAHMQMGGAENG